MSLYGGSRDLNLFRGLNRELLEDIIEQQVGYYKPKISENKLNVYGETTNKMWVGPVLIKCLIDRGEQKWATSDFGSDVSRDFGFRFFKDHLVDANVVPEVGDVIMHAEDFYEVNAIIENQWIVGKNTDYAYTDSVQNFGSSWSIILRASYSRPEKHGIKLNRL